MAEQTKGTDMADPPPGPLGSVPQISQKVACTSSTRAPSARPRTSKCDHIKVLVRIRPPLFSEGEQAITPSLAYGRPPSNDSPERRDGCKFDSLQPAVRVTKGQTSFEGEFDAVLPPGSSQEHVFDEVHDCIKHVIAGKNATVFAYGQTNSGKTYTMLGPSQTGSTSEASLSHLTEDHGIMPRAMAELLAAKKAAEGRGETMTICCTFLQVYNERVLDLLAHDSSTATTPRRRMQAAERSDAHANLEIRSGMTGVEVVGVAESFVESPGDVASVLSRGWSKRKVRETKYNESSSRSHLLLQVRVTHRFAPPASSDAEKLPAAAPAPMVVRCSTLSMVDLAGSERWEAVGSRASHSSDAEAVHVGGRRGGGWKQPTHKDEMAKINRSLTTLGRIVAMLARGQESGLPFRESKLTRLLQHSLGANSVTTMVATLSPNDEAVDENVSTLSFALSARQVKVHASVNESLDGGDADVAKARAYRQEIRRLKAQLAAATQSGQQASNLSDELAAMQRVAAQQNTEISRLKALVRVATNRESERGAGDAHKDGGVIMSVENIKQLRASLERERASNAKLKAAIRSALDQQASLPEAQEGSAALAGGGGALPKLVHPSPPAEEEGVSPGQGAAKVAPLQAMHDRCEADGEVGVDAEAKMQAASGEVVGEARDVANGPRTSVPRGGVTHKLWMHSRGDDVPALDKAVSRQQHPYAIPQPPQRAQAPPDGRYSEDSQRNGGKAGRTQQQQQNYHPRGHKAHSYLPAWFPDPLPDALALKPRNPQQQPAQRRPPPAGPRPAGEGPSAGRGGGGESEGATSSLLQRRMAALGLMPGPSVSTFHKERSGAGGAARKAGPGGRRSGRKQEVRMSLPSEVGRGAGWDSEGGREKRVAGRIDRAVSQSTEVFCADHFDRLVLKSVSTSPHVGQTLQLPHAGAQTERAKMQAPHAAAVPTPPTPRAPPPAVDGAGRIPLRKARARPLSASKAALGDQAAPRQAWLPSAAPLGVDCDLPHAAGKDVSVQAAQQTKENDAANVRGAVRDTSATGEKKPVALRAQSDSMLAVEAGGRPPMAASAADLSDLRGQLRQLVQSLRSGSSGLSLAQVKDRVADLRERIAAAEAV